MPVDRGNCSNGITDETNRIIEDIATVFRDFLNVIVVLLAARYTTGSPDDFAVLMSENRLHAGKSHSFRRVDAANPRVRHPGQLYVIGVGCFACYTLQSIDAWCGMADSCQGGDGGILLLSHREP